MSEEIKGSVELKLEDFALIARALVLLSCVLDGKRSDRALVLAGVFRDKGQDIIKQQDKPWSES